MKKALLIALAVVVVVVVIFAGIRVVDANNSNKVAAECLRGNQTACVYFQAQENVSAVKITLQEAKANLLTAREAYDASQQGGE